ncbi:MAG: hydantoinase B/oxoprolinase family protein [Gammaproteobacteria bacterium]|nr:hydantoinase B/oxoprolinase family protein [Gammaproteobacteria bacterium]
MDNIELSLFSSRISSVCDEMGAVLQRVAFSPNIKDRLDFSCAIFNAEGKLCAQAAHIPVHLGSMAYAMADVVSAIDWHEGDMVMLNDPYLGGTHLPDVTIIAPLFISQKLAGFVVNRAHHADIGAESPGSMPVSSSLLQEGVVIAPTKLIKAGQLDQSVMAALLAKLKNTDESLGDFNAQIGANRRGLERLQLLVQSLGFERYVAALQALNDYAASIAREALKTIPDGVYQFTDWMDDDGQGQQNIAIKVTLRVQSGQLLADFSGTAQQVHGNINCPLSVVAAAVFYVFRCLMPAQTPACAGSFEAIKFTAPEGCLLNARYPAAVAAGNVETSSRIVDVVMGALAQAVPALIPAASQGSMNNLAMGFAGNEQQASWSYYETIGGGMGAGAKNAGLSAVQTHMTNTLNTPIEVLEKHYPLRVHRYEIRQGSGGEGEHSGGDGIIREFEFLQPAQFTLLTERRSTQPWGINARPGHAGKNRLNDKPIVAKVNCEVTVGDRLRIETPGGGGWAADEFKP